MDKKLRHLAITMDGNRRYARAHNQLPWMGHKHGIEATKKAISFCLKRGIPYLSLYTLSLENFNRSPEELGYMFSFMLESIQGSAKELRESGVRIRFIGDRTKFPATLSQACQDLEKATQDCTALNVQSFFCYGGQQEIVAAAKKIAEDVAQHKISTEDITGDVFKKYLWIPAIPDPDLIIRTGGAQRLSNFILYQAAYAEFYFTDVYWPAMNENEFEKAIEYYQAAKQNFGL